MSKQKFQAKTNAEKAGAAQYRKPASELSLTEESVSEQPSLTSEPASDNPPYADGTPWEPHHAAFKQAILEFTKEQLLICKKDIDTQILSIDNKFAENFVFDFNKIPPELKNFVLDKIGATPKNPGKKATSTGDKKPRKRDPNSGYKDIEIAGVKYKVALLINTDAQEFWRYGNPEQTAWLTGLTTEQRYEKFGGVERLEKNPELLEEFARIPGAVLVKQADDTYKNYDGKPADAEQPTTAENAE